MPQGHMDRLTSFDTSFLTNEKANGHMAIGAVLVVLIVFTNLAADLSYSAIDPRIRREGKAT